MSASRLLIGVVAALLATSALAARPWIHSGHWSSQYDHDFRKYSKRYFGPFFDWHWFKAQAIVESTLSVRAQSPIGATGLMQITPHTYKHLIRANNPHFGSLNNPRWNIAGGIWYDHYLYSSQYWAKLAARQRLYFAFASYNAGLGGVLKACRRVPDKVTTWSQVAPYAAHETRDYVARIIRVKTNAPPPWLQAVSDKQRGEQASGQSAE